MSETADKLRELIRLHDEALWHALERDGHHKSNEGYVEICLTNSFDEEREKDPLRIKSIGVYSYVLGPSRMHYFDSVDQALDHVRDWHREEMEMP